MDRYGSMLFLGHLVIGLIAGFILFEFSHDKNAIIFCAMGSILPDIVDKPLGHIFLNSVLDNGKIYFHSLVIFLIFFVTGILVWRHFRSRSFLVVAMGVIIHQVVDGMWNRPINWYYPFLGPYQVEHHRDYVITVLISELSSVTEWVFFIAVVVIVLVAGIRWYNQEPAVMPDPLQTEQQRQLYLGLLSVATFVLMLSILIIWLWQPYQELVL